MCRVWWSLADCAAEQGEGKLTDFESHACAILSCILWLYSQECALCTHLEV